MQFTEVYKRLNGREATAEQVLEFERLVVLFETTPNDAIFCVLVALDHYKNLYSDIPAKIAASADSVLEKFKESAKKVADAAVDQAKESHAEALANIANKIAGEVSTKKMFQWICGSIVVAVACIALLTWYLHSATFAAGQAVGQAAGYEQAKNQIAAAAWANTPQGAQAYRLAQTGELDKLANCTGKGWKIDEGWCYPHDVKDEGTYGWRLP